jgi:hypothetical protein
MAHGNSKLARLARPHAARAIGELVAILENRWNSPATRVAAARAVVDFAYGRPAPRPRATPTPAPIPRVVRVDWGDEAA